MSKLHMRLVENRIRGTGAVESGNAVVRRGKTIVCQKEDMVTGPQYWNKLQVDLRNVENPTDCKRSFFTKPSQLGTL